MNEKEDSEFGVGLELVVEQLNLKTCFECDNLFFCKYLLYLCGNKRFCHLMNDLYCYLALSIVLYMKWFQKKVFS